MTPIYIPPQPVQIVRQRIQNQAAIQEQLRAYDEEQQAILNANDVRFNANNIGRKTTMFPEPSLAGLAAKQRRQEAAEEQEFQRKKELSQQPIDPARIGLDTPARKRGRPKGAKGKKKTQKELFNEIKGTGVMPPESKDFSILETQDLARERGISIYKGE